MSPSRPNEADLKSTVARFLSDEGGAVTVDWVVLSSAIVGLGIAVTLVVSGGLQTLSTDISDALGGVEVQTRFAEALADLGFAVL
ncbi:MAG: hypothetical protein AAF914_08745, partial [Pseudomonadota bacterium]